MYYDEVREKIGEEEKQYCKLDAEQFFTKAYIKSRSGKYSKQNTDAKLDTISPYLLIIGKDIGNMCHSSLFYAQN
jgi:hypothetical protein